MKAKLLDRPRPCRRCGEYSRLRQCPYRCGIASAARGVATRRAERLYNAIVEALLESVEPPDLDGPAELPATATQTPPGTCWRVAVYAQRASLGVSLFHPHDRAEADSPPPADGPAPRPQLTLQPTPKREEPCLPSRPGCGIARRRCGLLEQPAYRAAFGR